MAAKIDTGVRELCRHFGRLVSNHRRRLGWSQERLAEEADISEGMVAKIETGATGVRFPMIVKIAAALGVEPVELFYSQMPKGKLHQGKLRELVVRLEELSDGDLLWVHELMIVAMKATGRGNFEETSSRPQRKPATLGRKVLKAGGKR